VQLSSQGIEKPGERMVGKDYDPATGQFAVEHLIHRARSDRQLPAGQRRLQPVPGDGLVPGRHHDPAPGPPVVQKQTATVKDC